MIVETLDTGEVAYLLRQALGRQRTNWSDFLADCTRKKTNYLGLRLLPVVRVKLAGDRCKRPRYGKQEVVDFIIAAVKLSPRPTAVDRTILKIAIEIDPAMLTLPLGLRSATPA